MYISLKERKTYHDFNLPFKNKYRYKFINKINGHADASFLIESFFEGTIIIPLLENEESVNKHNRGIEKPRMNERRSTFD
jgi:hypothetical protein